MRIYKIETTSSEIYIKAKSVYHALALVETTKEVVIKVTEINKR